MYVKDLAIELLRRDHLPIVYSTLLGEVAHELRTATVPVIDDLGLLSVVPDIIHGNHHLELMTALLRFPGVPAVHVCHAWGSWEAAPPRFPRIRRYVAVDHTCRDSLVCESGVPKNRAVVILNWVDLDRFGQRGPLPPRPKRALVYSNYAGDGTLLEAVRSACEAQGLSLDVRGAASGNTCRAPESLLPQYDLVFAKARCALEAMASGAAVVLCDFAGAGPLVTSSNWDRLRKLNFGRRALCHSVTAEYLVDQISNYNPDDAGEVTRRTRESAGLAAATDQLIELYREVVAEHKAVGVPYESDHKAASEYLAWLTPYAQSHSMLHAKVEECARLRAERDWLRGLLKKAGVDPYS